MERVKTGGGHGRVENEEEDAAEKMRERLAHQVQHGEALVRRVF